MEHVAEELPFRISFDEIERRFGVGTRVYWHFLTFIIVSNLLLGIVMGASFLQYMTTNRADSVAQVHCFEVAAPFFVVPDGSGAAAPVKLLFEGGVRQELARESLAPPLKFSFNEIFISAYTRANNRGAWIATTVIAVLLTHLFPVAFYFYIKKRVLANKQNEYDNPFAFSGLETTQIPGNDRYTEFTRTLRTIGSIAVYLLLLVISFAIIFSLESQKRDNRGAVTIANVDIIDIAVTLVVTIINAVFGALAGVMTTFEKHLTYAAYRRSHTIKLYSFKILNVSAMYAAVGVVAISSACPYFDAGRKFLILILTDLVVQNLLEILVPWIKMRVLPLISTKFAGSSSDEANRPEFDLAQEYLELFYRQFVIYVGFTVFPLLPLCGFIVNLIEYPLDKYRMTKVCQRPKRVDVSMKWLLSVLLLCNAVIAFALPPLGTVWLLTGKVGVYEAHPYICPVFGEPTVADDSASLVQPLYKPICRALNATAAVNATATAATTAITCNASNILAPTLDVNFTQCTELISYLFDRKTALPRLAPTFTADELRVLRNPNGTACVDMAEACILPFEALMPPRQYTLRDVHLGRVGDNVTVAASAPNATATASNASATTIAATTIR